MTTITTIQANPITFTASHVDDWTDQYNFKGYVFENGLTLECNLDFGDTFYPGTNDVVCDDYYRITYTETLIETWREFTTNELREIAQFNRDAFGPLRPKVTSRLKELGVTLD